MRFLLAIVISAIATSTFGAEPAKSSYSIKLVARMSDGQLFGSEATCKRNVYCGIRFGNSFGMDIIERDNEYSLFVVDYDRYALPCCSFANGKSHYSFGNWYDKRKIDLYQSADDDLVYRKRKLMGELYISISRNANK